MFNVHVNVNMQDDEKRVDCPRPLTRREAMDFVEKVIDEHPEASSFLAILTPLPF